MRKPVVQLRSPKPIEDFIAGTAATDLAEPAHIERPERTLAPSPPAPPKKELEAAPSPLDLPSDTAPTHDGSADTELAVPPNAEWELSPDKGEDHDDDQPLPSSRRKVRKTGRVPKAATKEVGLRPPRWKRTVVLTADGVPLKRMTITMSEEIAFRLAYKCEEERISVSECLEELARKYLARRS